MKKSAESTAKASKSNSKSKGAPRSKTSSTRKKRESIGVGWQCPWCEKIHAPDIKTCGCQAKEATGSSAWTKERVENLKRIKPLMEEWQKRLREATEKEPTPPPMEWPRPHYAPIYVLPVPTYQPQIICSGGIVR